MTNIVAFISRNELSRAENLAAFIDAARQTMAFGCSIDWDALSWDITDQVNLSSHGEKRFRLNWVNFASSKGKCASSPLDPAYVDFAKAHITYLQARHRIDDQSIRISAHRLVEAALLQVKGRADPSEIDYLVLNAAVALARANFGQAAAYQRGLKLQDLAEFLCEARLTRAPFPGWKSSLKKPPALGSRIGEIFESRKALMPSDDDLQLVGKAFFLAATPAQRILTSIFGLLVASPIRFSEFLKLPLACEAWLPDGKGGLTYCLRWWPSKGGEPQIKPIVGSFVPIVQEAVRRLIDYGEPAREMALWYEAHPTQVFLPATFEELRYQVGISIEDVADLLSIQRGSVIGWCRLRGIPFYFDEPCEKVAVAGGRFKRFAYVRFADFEAAVIAELPIHSPFMNRQTGLRYSEALCVLPFDFLAGRPSRCNFRKLTIARINQALGSDKRGSANPKTSVFDSLDLSKEDGTAVRLTTKMFRHFLNTEAQKRGLGEMQTAIWSGRKDISQNPAYDHVSADEIIEAVKENRAPDLIENSLPAAATNRAVSRRAFMVTPREPGRIAHITDNGVCLHDFSMEPCNWFLNCTTCTEHECEKRDEAHGRQARADLALAEEMLADAIDADHGGVIDSDRWVDAKQREIVVLRALVAVYDDDDIPCGSRLTFNRSAYELVAGAAPLHLARDHG